MASRTPLALKQLEQAFLLLNSCPMALTPERVMAYQGFHLEQLLEGPWDPHTMHIGGPFDTIKGPTVFLYKRLHNVYISFFLFNVTTNTCHLKMHHSRPLKKKETGLHLKAYLKSTC